ncbi:N-acetylmuramoyl-L-alanine amidase [Salibacterium lacus]|uniref:N-acetylmuramoyl-L-alanine amidase n=1 Tax=Salibacterium lacus TaxID=1898109 RepID=A0ABW5T5B3_9BACI
MMAAALSFSVIPAFSAEHAEASDRYADVDNGYWAEEEIEYLTEQGVADGDASGDYRPEQPLTRAQASIMMTNALGEGALNAPSPTFSDVDSSFWAYGSIEKAAELDIFQGNNGSFNPNGEIEKAQVAAVISRAFFDQAAEPDTAGSFSDIDSDFWAEEYIATLADQGIVQESGSFDPNDSATRAEFSAYLARAMEETMQSSGNGNSSSSPDEEDFSDENVMYKGEVDADTPLNVRSGPGTGNQAVNQLSDGTSVDVYGRDGDWLKIENAGDWAYVHGAYVTTADNSEEDNTSETPDEDTNESPSDDVQGSVISAAKVTVNDLNVRTEGSTDGDVITKLQSGDTVDVYEHTGEDWARIDYGSGEGYVHRHYLQEKEPGADALEDRTIVIDAGHGDHDNGASGNGLIEKEMNLDVALEVEERLEEAGVDVVMTRDDDTFLGLNERVDVAESVDADAFVSIHSNAYKQSAHGTEAFYNGSHKASESRALASSIQQELVKQTSMTDRRVADAGFVVIENTTMPSSLVELGFLTNPSDAAQMKKADYPDKAANAIFDGIDNYYNW